MPPFATKTWLNGRENGVAARWNAAAVNDLETRIETAIGSGVGSGGGGPSIISPGTVVSNQTLSLSTHQEVLWVVTLGAQDLKLEITGWSAGKAVTLVIKQDAVGNRALHTSQGLPTALWHGGAIPPQSLLPNAKDVRGFFHDGVSTYGFESGTGMA